jgi:hypothetical protein
MLEKTNSLRLQLRVFECGHHDETPEKSRRVDGRIVTTRVVFTRAGACLKL